MARTSLQAAYFDAPLSAYAGQLAETITTYSQNLRGYICETDVVIGRGVIKGAAITPTQSGQINAPAPIQVKAVLSGTVLADVVGVVVRDSTAGVLNATDDSIIEATDVSTILALGSGELIYVDITAAVTHGDAVYMAVEATNSAGNAPLGTFHDDAAGTVGMIAITGATFYGDAAAGEVGKILLG